MTFRFSLILGLVAALPSAVLPAARAANGYPQTSSAPATTTITDQATWRRSEQAVNADIRFKKPDGVVFTDQLEEPAKKDAEKLSQKAASQQGKTAPVGKPSYAPISASISAPAAAPSAASIQGSVLPTIQPVARPPIALMPTTNLPSIPMTHSPATPTAITATPSPMLFPTTQQRPADTASNPTNSAAAPATAAQPISDDQIQQVARLLIDRGVITAAQEEPLPASPNNRPGSEPIPSARNSGDLGPDGEGCYDDCACCPPQPCLFWVGGVEATFLSPDLNGEGVSFEVAELATDRYDLVTTESDDVDSLYIAPRIWLGVQGCCWGANLRYWHLRANNGANDPSIGASGEWDDFDCKRPDLGYFTCNQLDAYTVDFEITRRFCIHNCWMQAGFGVRHAEIWHDQGITGLALTDEGLLNGYARANRNSRGTGILLSLYGRKPIYPCSCVNWFYNARWSALWGPTQTAAETFAGAMATDPDFVATAASVNGAYTTVDDTLFIGEIQLGLEWNYSLACLPANAFFRTAIEYQRWDGGSGFSQANSFAGITIDDGDPATSIVDTNAAAEAPQMDLLGFTIGTGLTW